jgi:enolase
MQEAMFLILSARDYQEAQEMTVRLQNRLKEIIENEEGCRVMGIGLEGGIAPYIERGSYPLPEVRLWVMMKKAITECGFNPGVDVAIALDPAMTELEIAYRKQFKIPDSVGMYLYWRDKALTVMDRDAVLDLYLKAIHEYDIPILSIEDGFSEDDYEGWQNALEALGDRIFIIGDDLVTTNDRTIELAASKGMINTSLIKANQIGSLYETILAMLVALGKGQELVVSHRSKSPNDDMEAQIALAVNSLGLKAGGGANTERLVKYSAVTELMQRGREDDTNHALKQGQTALVHRIYAYEEPTNAGVPTVGATVEFSLPDSGVRLKFRGATPLGTSAGSGEAIHLVDSSIEGAEYRELIGRYPDYFDETEPGVFSFAKNITESEVKGKGDDALSALFIRTQRYNGKGCLNAVDNVVEVIAPVFTGRVASSMTLMEIDRILLSLEVRVAQRRGKLGKTLETEERVQVMQRKQNIGMNAMLSVSLALARGVAHLKGKDLFELLREEMLSVIQRLASEYEVEISGSQFSDYISALRETNKRLEEDGKSLCSVLREITGIYDDTEEVEAELRHPQDVQSAEVPDVRLEEEEPQKVYVPDITVLLIEEEEKRLAEVNEKIREAYLNEANPVVRQEALIEYIKVKHLITERTGRFGIANNRIFQDQDELIIPYMIANTLLVQRVQGGRSSIISTHPILKGTILTDEFLKELAGFSGDAVDLEKELYEFGPDRAAPVWIARIRDMVEHLKKINQSANRVSSTYVLMILAARLSVFSFKKYLNAKNLQSEVQSLLQEVQQFLNTSLPSHLPYLARIMVRNIAGVVTKPKLIDRLWNNTIDLAEIHVRGSDIVNELRRSTHHAVGRRTLLLAKAYQKYLETGEVGDLSDFGYPEPAPADMQAREKKQSKEIVGIIVDDLDELLGSSEIIGRIMEWQSNYEKTLLRCGFGKSITEEVEETVKNGIQKRNRWTYYHHLRIIRSRAKEFHDLQGGPQIDTQFSTLLEMKPDEMTFDAGQAEIELRQCADELVNKIRVEYQDELFKGLEKFLDAYKRAAYAEASSNIHHLRKTVRKALTEKAFPEQRLLLYEFDCLLEEIGYLALRHIAEIYEEDGVDIPQCLDLIRFCIINFSHEGVHSRQLQDLAGILSDSTKTYAEIANILEQIQRNYHHIIQRLLSPFEKMRDKLQLDDEEFRTSLANMQRYQHDLNSMAYFCDLARSYIEDNVTDQSQRIDGGAGRPAVDESAYDILHLSHRDEIRERVEAEKPEHSMRDSYGGKGSGLAYISYLDIPTRDGFIIPTLLPRFNLHEKDSERLEIELAKHLKILEEDISKRDSTPRRFADMQNPLLLAVRGGSVFSMPGILSTVVFVGMNDEIADSMAREDPWHAYDSYRRFLASYGQAVWGVDIEAHNIVDVAKDKYSVKYKYDVPWEGMKNVAEETKNLLRKEGYGKALDELLGNPEKQLLLAVRAVFDSWNREVVHQYRDIKGISETWNTAAIVQEMACGNRRNEDLRIGLDETRASLTGVISRTLVNDVGVRESLGDFKFSAAGDDLVGGLTTSISFQSFNELEAYMPYLNRKLKHTVTKLRRFMGTDQEIEFTVERGLLSILQSRAAEVGSNEKDTAFEDPGEEVTRGIGVRGGAFRGIVAFDETDLKKLAIDDFNRRDDVDGVMIILENPTPEDIPLIISADGLLATKGGSTSHAAVAINSINHKDYTAVMSASNLRVRVLEHEALILDADGSVRNSIRTGDIISIHGSTGMVYIGTQRLRHI